MLNIILSQNWQGKILDSRLLELVSEGFQKVEGCFVLKFFSQRQQHVKKEDFQDNVGYECFINSLHTDDYVDDDFVVQGVLLVEEVFRLWNSNQPPPGLLEAIVSETDFGANVKFHLVRNDETWLPESDLDKFSEAVLIAESLPQLGRSLPN